MLKRYISLLQKNLRSHTEIAVHLEVIASLAREIPNPDGREIFLREIDAIVVILNE